MKKTIQIDASAMRSSGGGGTRSRRRASETTAVASAAVPANASVPALNAASTLKNRLLRRIKEHKHKELANIRNELAPTPKSQPPPPSEFQAAMKYIAQTTQANKSKTLKRLRQGNHGNTEVTATAAAATADPNVSLVLPQEFDAAPQSSLILSGKSNGNGPTSSQVPYGCLKGGQKPLYRTWKRAVSTGRPTNAVNDVLSFMMDEARPATPPKKSSGGSNSINDDRIQLRAKSVQSTREWETAEDDLVRARVDEALRNIAKNSNSHSNSHSNNEDEIDVAASAAKEEVDALMHRSNSNSNSGSSSSSNRGSRPLLKKTIRRKYVVGKNASTGKVAVLLSSKGTRKQVAQVQKRMRQTTMRDIKRYLKSHGMMKVDSVCPPDILRKMYESVVSAGDVTNTNKEMLVHNFLRDEDAATVTHE